MYAPPRPTITTLPLRAASWMTCWVIWSTAFLVSKVGTALGGVQAVASGGISGSLLARLLVALGSASTEPLIPPEATAWTPPNAAPTFDTRKAVLQITQHVIEEAARAGNVVIVGRGGAYILRDLPGALHVFLRAAEAVRVKTIMARFKIFEEEARKRMKQTDENWTSYIKQVYGHDRNHPAHYDMVLDSGRLGYDATVEAILSALKTRKPIT